MTAVLGSAHAWVSTPPWPPASVELAPIDVDADAVLLHAWVTHPRSRYWQMLHADLEQVRREYAAIAANPHHDAWLGHVDGEPLFLVETYDPAHSPLAGLVELHAGDRGMHILVAPPRPGQPPRHGLTSIAMAAAMRACFDDPAVTRVVVEPDAGNSAIAAKNAQAGFTVLGQVRLPDKLAHFCACTRAQFRAGGLAGVLS